MGYIDRRRRAATLRRLGREFLEADPNYTPICQLQARCKVTVIGRIDRIETDVEGNYSVELSDMTARVWLTWSGRKTIPGLRTGVYVSAQGTVGSDREGSPQIMNPKYSILVV